MNKIEYYTSLFVQYTWGMPTLTLLVAGGLFFMIYSEFLPLRYLRHSIQILRGKYDLEEAKGEINHFQALVSALAQTIGMGNISGVAVAIATGGPGALFWMWISAILGITTKFFTCTLSVMYREKTSNGQYVGGPMYVIKNGLEKKWHFLAIIFSVAGLIGTSSLFQTNQMIQVIRDVVLIPNGWITENPLWTNLILGILSAIFVGLVILGGLKRIGDVASKWVPFMVLLYFIGVLYIIFSNISTVPHCFMLIFKDAFAANSAMGGAIGSLIILGAKRAAFSNEAGVGTAPMMHGDTITHEPIHEGFVAMFGPIIDTLVVCTLTALAIIISGVWKTSDADGVTLTAMAFKQSMPTIGAPLLISCVILFALSTLFTFSHYGSKCWEYLWGPKYLYIFNYIYLGCICLGGVFSLQALLNIIDGSYAIMIFPTMISTLLLAPQVKKALKEYMYMHKKRKEILNYRK